MLLAGRFEKSYRLFVSCQVPPLLTYVPTLTAGECTVTMRLDGGEEGTEGKNGRVASMDGCDDMTAAAAVASVAWGGGL